MGRHSVLRGLPRNRLGLAGLVLVSAIVFVAVVGPWLSPYDYREIHLDKCWQPPSRDHAMGTDAYGRDLLTRIMMGARISLRIVIASVGVSMGIGMTLGAIAGYGGGVVDGLAMRLVDIFMAIPQLYFMLVLAAVLGRGVNTTILAISLTTWVSAARLMRAVVLSLKQKDFVLASRSVGATPLRTVVVHIVPNAGGALIVQATLFAAQAIILEAGLSFLGMGVQPPTPSWGSILSEGRRDLLVAPWIATFPGLAVFLTVLGLYLLGDGLRDALDPKQRKRTELV